MQLDSVITAMTAEVYERLRQAVETGKWADGTRLTDAQKETSLQAVLIWQSKHNRDPQHMTVGPDGILAHKSKQELKQQFSASSSIPIVSSLSSD
ncbi:MAG: YeaC family protein [Plesiomonas sp.]